MSGVAWIVLLAGLYASHRIAYQLGHIKGVREMNRYTEEQRD